MSATNPILAEPSGHASPEDEDFEFLLTLLDLGTRLQVLVAECSTEEVREGLRRRLVLYSQDRGRPFRAPDIGEKSLDWLADEQAAQARQAAEGRRTAVQPVLFLPMPESMVEETFLLHRMNENRDNLRRDMRGSLCIAGLPGMVARMQVEAPDFWSIHARTFRFRRVESFGLTRAESLGLPSTGHAMAELSELLAEYYPFTESARRVATGAGLDLALIAFHASATVNWFNILRHAQMSGRLADLVDVVAADYPGNARLAALREALEPAAVPVHRMQSRREVPYVSIGRLPTTGLQLFGRQKELAWLDACWRDGVRVASVVAWAGGGKSALVNAWLAKLRDDGWRGAQRVFGWSFFSQGTDRLASSDEFIEVALRWFADPSPTRGSAWDKGERLAALVRRERTILVLDGLEPLQWGPGVQEGKLKDQAMEALLKDLAAQNNGLCLLTSRINVADQEGVVRDKVRVLELEHLTPDAGAELLRARGVKGLDAELREAAAEHEGHGLALALLGSYLVDFADGDIRRRKELGPLEEDQQLGPHARRVMAAYERWLAKHELAVLLMLGLFDRPAGEDEIAALRATPPIEGLTDALAEIMPRDWSRGLTKLRRVGLLAADKDGRLDTHPLVREHFGERLRRTHPEAWREGHRRLYDHLRNKAKEFPDTIEELAPLYAAVVHGCLAGMNQEALAEVFVKRIHRGAEYFSQRHLGASGSEVAVLSAFFDPPWERLAPGLSEPAQAWVLANASFALRALGRLSEATGLLRLGVARDIQGGDWKNAAIGAANLSGLLEARGELREAEAAARESVAYADKSGDAFQRLSTRTTLAAVLHALGRRDEAIALFEDAERMQKEVQPSYPLLYSLQGFQYCDLLFDLGRETEVLVHATQTLKWLEATGGLLDIALAHLSLGRAYLVAARKDESGTERSAEHLKLGVDGLRRAGIQEFMPLGLLARAAFHIHNASGAGWKPALHDLDEALDLSTRCGFRLHEADAHLEHARLALASGEPASAHAHLAAARAIIDETGYHRRDAKLAQLEAASAFREG